LHRFLAHKIGSSQSKVAFWLVGLTVLVLFLFLAKPFFLVCGESHILLSDTRNAAGSLSQENRFVVSVLLADAAHVRLPI